MSGPIKLTGMFELEITLPDGIRLPFSFTQNGSAPESAPRAPAATVPDTPAAFPKTRNGEIAERVARFIREGGSEGRTRTEISQQFASSIRNGPQRDAILAMLPTLLYRQSIDPNPSTGKPTGAERWRYLYSESDPA